MQYSNFDLLEDSPQFVNHDVYPGILFNDTSIFFGQILLDHQ
jgi:hypothetical protein